MGMIRELCDGNGMRLEVFASYMGMLPSLLRSMDEKAVSVPAEIRKSMDDFVLLRDSLIEGFEKNLVAQKKNISEGYREHCNLVLVYASQRDYESLPDHEPLLNHVTHRYVIEVLQERMREKHGIEVSAVIFDRPSYELWLGSHTDSLESRAMWAVEHMFKPGRMGSVKTH